MYARRRIHGLPFTVSYFENAKPQDQLKVDRVDLFVQDARKACRRLQGRTYWVRLVKGAQHPICVPRDVWLPQGQ